MVENTSQLNRIVTLYREELARLGFQVTAVFVYGFYAHGTYRIDIHISYPSLEVG